MKKIIFISHNFFGLECLKEFIELLDGELKNLGKIRLVISRKFNEKLSDYSPDFKKISESFGIIHLETSNINDEKIKEKMREVGPDYIFVFGWSQMIDNEILAMPRIDIFGSHPSILPKNRGSGVIPWQILNQEKKSGVTLFQLTDKLDSGAIVAQELFELAPEETAQSFYTKVIQAGRKLIQSNLKNILLEEYQTMPQDESKATFLGRRKPEDGLINWEKSAELIDRLIRAVGPPYPGAYTYYENEKVIILEAEQVAQRNYIGTTGSVLAKTNEGVLVQTGDGLLNIKKISTEKTGENLALEYLKPWTRLGINLPVELIQLRREVAHLKTMFLEEQK
jgi:methionyl-tRNA formyltransferase